MLAVDLFCGLGGWTDGLLAEGWQVVGFDIERHAYGDAAYPAQLVIQDVLTIHGSQFKDADLIVASPPCQEFSYMAMPWSLAKDKAQRIRSDPTDWLRLCALFDACFRIQREACEAAGRHIPMIVENVRGAQEWVGRSRWNFGSFHLWGDVPALMPMAKTFKQPGTRFDGSGKSWQSEAVKITTMGAGWYPPDHPKHVAGLAFNTHAERATKNRNPVHELTASVIKQGGDWFNAEQPSISRMSGSKSKARKAASAMIAKIPMPLARYIGATFRV